jgi:hypothetical protein
MKKLPYFENNSIYGYKHKTNEPLDVKLFIEELKVVLDKHDLEYVDGYIGIDKTHKSFGVRGAKIKFKGESGA